MQHHRIASTALTLALAAGGIGAATFGAAPASAASLHKSVTLPTNNKALPYLDTVSATVDFDSATNKLTVTVKHRGDRPAQELGFRFYEETVAISGGQPAGDGIYLSVNRQPFAAPTSSGLLATPTIEQQEIPITVTEKGAVTTYVAQSPKLANMAKTRISGWTTDGPLGFRCPDSSDDMPSTRL